jgi:sulfide:quinone oxidoreductase
LRAAAEEFGTSTWDKTRVGSSTDSTFLTPRASRPVGRGRDILVIGGGLGGLEALLGLRVLLADASLTLLSASRTSAIRPELVGRPWAWDPVGVDLRAFCAAVGVSLRLGTQTAVDPATRVVQLADYDTLPYDELFVAGGGVDVAPYPGVRTLGMDRANSRCASGARRLTVVVPPGVSWTLPAYELAVQAARDPDLTVELVSAEVAPLSAFGDRAPQGVVWLFGHAGVQLLPRAVIPLGSDVLTLLESVVTLPLRRGPAIAGLPSEGDGFLPVDGRGRVIGAAAVHAAGASTSRVFNQGELEGSDAEAAAIDIAATRAGREAPRVLRGTLVASDGATLQVRRVLDGRDLGTSNQFPASPDPPAAWRLTAWLNADRSQEDGVWSQPEAQR